jgi:hypothetical protein
VETRGLRDFVEIFSDKIHVMGALICIWLTYIAGMPLVHGSLQRSFLFLRGWAYLFQIIELSKSRNEIWGVCFSSFMW